MRRFLGPVRRAGQGVLPHGTPGGEAAVLRRAGFAEPERMLLPAGKVVVRSADDVVAAAFFRSDAAPHLFGDQFPTFEATLRDLLHAASPSGRFADRLPDTEVMIWRKAPEL